MRVAISLGRETVYVVHAAVVPASMRRKRWALTLPTASGSSFGVHTSRRPSSSHRSHDRVVFLEVLVQPRAKANRCMIDRQPQGFNDINIGYA